MEGLTPASADDLPPLSELLVDDPFWQYPAWGLAREGVGHLRIWATATASPGYLAVVTEPSAKTDQTEPMRNPWGRTRTSRIRRCRATVRVFWEAGTGGQATGAR